MSSMFTVGSSWTRRRLRAGWTLCLGGVAVLAGCPGYLEEQAWFPDGGRVLVGGVQAPGPAPADGAATPPPAAPPPAAAIPDAAAAPPPPAAALDPPKADAGGGAAMVIDAGASAPPAALPVPACATAAEITAKILMPKCAGCHGGAMPRAGLDLAMPGAKARLLNVASRGCMGKPLIVSDPAVGGHLFDKLAGPVAGCGMRMPLNGMPLTPDEIKCLKDWIKPTPPEAAPPPPPPAAPAVPVPACATAAEITAKILVPKCGTCHGVNLPASGLDLVTAGAKARLLNIPSRACNAKPLIVSDPAVGGHFFDKLAGAIPGCGNQMPFGALPLSAAEVKCLKDWIKPTP
jgi:hypothetical protein